MVLMDVSVIVFVITIILGSDNILGYDSNESRSVREAHGR